MDHVRFATVADYKAGREFCIVRVDVSASGIKISARRRARIKHLAVKNELRHDGFGAIDRCQLGVFYDILSKPNSQSSHVVDYIENIDAAIALSKITCETIRLRLIGKLESQLHGLINCGQPTVITDF